MVVTQAEYLILMAACLLVTLPLEFVFTARVYRSPRRLIITLLPVVLVFTVWDLAGIAAGHWRYNPTYVTGLVLIGRLPVEELVFFIVIPICGLLTYRAVGYVLAAVRSRPSSAKAGNR
ncbi:lycopene cyclase domain-containing protein [Microlunatus elymi]|uniref:Lycopene cyclase domain-containing protein n=1 Tax=Microlunatus elymi TaxID=2596828 RepID=A0A516PW87_9ACTN|nr:lycopene cyclase domain-containing protein [Microlunatus elymi]QDP95419.1 lycopene cyclase domain-containing protein [Microlunatus elymi]